MYQPENYDILPGIKNKLPFDRDVNYEYNCKFKIRFLDLDSNDHVNNITYIDYVCTSIYRILKVPVFIKTFNIVFKKEITINDEDVEIYLNEGSNEFNFRIVNNNNLFSYGRITYSLK